MFYEFSSAAIADVSSMCRYELFFRDKLRARKLIRHVPIESKGWIS